MAPPPQLIYSPPANLQLPFHLAHDFRNSSHRASWGSDLSGPLPWDSSNSKATLPGVSECIQLSPDERTLTIAVGSDLYLYDSLTLDPVRTLGKAQGVVRRLDYSPDGTLFVTHSEDRGPTKPWPWKEVVNLWTFDEPTSSSIAEFEGTLAFFGGSPFSQDGKTLFYLPSRTSVAVVDIATGVQKFTLDDHNDYIAWVGDSPDGTMIGTSSWDSALRLWNSTDGTLIHNLQDGPYRVQSWMATFSPDSKKIAVGTGGGVWLWDAVTGGVIFRLEEFEDWTRTLAFSADGKSLAVGGGGGELKVFDVETGERKQHWLVDERKMRMWTEVSEVHYSEVGKRLIFKIEIGRTMIYDEEVNEKWEIEQEVGRTVEGFWTETSLLAKDGKTVWIAGQDKSIRRWTL